MSAVVARSYSAYVNRISTTLAGLLLVLIVAAAGALVYGLIVDPTVGGPIAGAAAVVAVAIVQRRWEKKQELERVRREHMAPIYEQLIEILQNAEAAESETGEFFKDLTTKLLLYGPPAIVKEWVAFKNHGVSEDKTDPTSLLNYEKFLLLVRKDFGHDDSELAQGELLRTYVNDFDEMYALWQAKQAAESSSAEASELS
jgi:hypothetical protein